MVFLKHLMCLLNACLTGIPFLPNFSHYYLIPTKLITKYYSGDQVEINDLGGACSTYGGKERRIQDFGRET
jgi:hypothetical protein